MNTRGISIFRIMRIARIAVIFGAILLTIIVPTMDPSYLAIVVAVALASYLKF